MPFRFKGLFTQCDNDCDKTVSLVKTLMDIHANHSEMEVIVAVTPCEHPQSNILLAFITVTGGVVSCESALKSTIQDFN